MSPAQPPGDPVLDPPRAGVAVRTELTGRTISAADAVEAVAHPQSGGTAVFVGTVRDHHDGVTVCSLTYEAWEERAEQALEEVAREVADEFPGVRAVHVAHRTGELAVGEASVVCAASAPHREEALAAASRLIDLVKERVPIWKHEHLADGSSRWAGEPDGVDTSVDTL